ncbi:hypothetical protein Pan110_53270 [Gimesia panareensis]|nr:hypothetical protein Pan110_53270 [Gimesia panareensis]
MGGEVESRIREKIQKISDLEEAHGNFGVGFRTKDGVLVPTSEAVLDHIIGVLEAVKRLDTEPESLKNV